MEIIASYLSQYGLLIIPVLLMASAFGAPLPEDVVTVTSAYLVYQGVLPQTPTLVVLFVSIMVADTVMYMVGRVLRAKVLPEHRLRQIATWVERWGVGLVFVSRFFVGVRAVVFVGSGALKVPLHKFWMADIAAGLVFIPSLFFLTLHWGEDIAQLLALVKVAGQSMATVVVAGIALVAAMALIGHLKKSKKSKSKEAAENI